MSEDLRRRRRQKTFATREHAPAASRARRAPPARQTARPVVDPSTLRPADAGRPLEPEVRRRLEAALDRPLGHVRVHTTPADRERTQAMGARAFAHRHHIWLGKHESASDVGLLAHEVAHVAQQGFAPAARAAPSPLTASTHAVRPPTRGAAPHSRAASRAAAPPSRPAPAVQRFDLDIDLIGNARRAAGAVGSGIRAGAGAVVAGARAVGGAVVEAGESLVTAGRDVVLGVVKRVAPDFLPLFEGDGIVGFVRRLAEKALRSMFDGLLGPLRGVLDFDAIGARITQALSWIAGIAGQLARGDCSGVLAAARKVADFFSTALKPVADKVKSISDKVSGFFKGIWEQIGAPLMEMLKKIGGPLWDSLKKFARDVAAVLRKAKEAVGAAWERVKDWFGIGAETGEEEGGGLWNWIKDKAKSVGDSIADAVKPVMGPLRAAGAALLLIIPGGQIVLVIMLWPRLKQAWNWLSQKWEDLNLIPRARHFLANTVLPMLMDAAEAVGQALVAGADWLLGLLQRVAGAVASVVKGAKGLLAPLGTVISFAHGHFQRMVNWARAGLRSASRNMRSLLQRLIRFLGRVLQAMLQLIAIAVNPFGIVGFLAGTIWRLIPECLKGPIIDFILEVIIRVLRALPPMPMLGLLWPLIKSAALGFLERVLSFSIQRKVNVSNKMARIISGMSPTFALGYLRGIGLGLWEEITGPFQALAALFELPALIQSFLNSLGVRLCELIDKIRCFARTLAGRVFGSIGDLLSGLAELFGDPERVLDLIRCAIEGALSAAAGIGSAIADRMMAVFESADDAIGEALGRLTASALVQAALAYFTAGVGNSLGIVNRIAGALRTAGRAIRQVIGVLRGLFGRLVGAVRGLASRLARGAAAGGRSVLGRLGGFFRGVANWFGRLFGRIGRGLARRFRLNPRQMAQWQLFLGAVTGLVGRHLGGGVRRQQLADEYRGILRRFRPVAKAPAFITKHRGFWRLWVRKVRRPLPRRIARVQQDERSRWREAVRAVRRRLDRVRPRQRNERALNDILRRLKGPWNFSLLEARPDRQEFDFNIIGAMSPPQEIAEVPENFATEDNPLPLRYPKRASSGYPPLYFGPRTGGVTLRQRELRAARSSDERKNRIARMLPAPRRTNWQQAGMPIEEYRPHESKPMPLGGRQIGVAANYQVVRGKKLKLRPGDGTPGGGRINRLIRAYGYSPANEGADGDHVVEIQLGGIDHLNNLWPLDSSENRSAGATLASMSFNTPSGTAITMRQLKTLARQGRDIWFRISSTR